jgi:tetratricopeptide (TPR) repeat protein
MPRETVVVQTPDGRESATTAEMRIDKADANIDEAKLPATKEAGEDSRILPDPRKPDWSRRDYVEAIAKSTEAMSNGSSKIGAMIDRGIYYSRIGQYDMAITDFSGAISLDRRNARAYHNRGVVWILKGDLERAIADLNEAIRLNPSHDAAYDNRGLAYQRKGRLADAAADFTKARQLRGQE